MTARAATRGPVSPSLAGATVLLQSGRSKSHTFAARSRPLGTLAAQQPGESGSAGGREGARAVARALQQQGSASVASSGGPVLPSPAPEALGFSRHHHHSHRVVPVAAGSSSDGKGGGFLGGIFASLSTESREEVAEDASAKPSRERTSNRAWRSRTGRARPGRTWIPRAEQLELEESLRKSQDETLADQDRWRLQERVNSLTALESQDEFEGKILSLITSPAAVELQPTQDEGRRRMPVKDDDKFKPEATGKEILLQGFNWESHKQQWFKVIGDAAEELAGMGFTLVWLPPSSQSVSHEGYMPTDYYNLNSNYGSEEELRECIKSLHRAGLGVLADIVINHRCAQFQDEHGIWNKYGGKMSWDQRAIVGDDPNFRGRGNRATGALFHAAPNIDHTQEFVRQDIKQWLEWLHKDIGYDGWRFDFTKGYGGEFVGEYVEHTTPLFAVGEFWDTLSYSGGYLDHNQNGHRQRTVDWLNAARGNSLAFDMTTKGILHAVLENNEYWRLSDQDGKPPGVMGWWPSKTCTFIENHDTGSTQGHWRFPDHGVEQGYAYILTHPGTPTVFWDHYKAPHWQPAIKKLMEIRRDYAINCRSQVHILKADSGVYAAQIDDRLIMKIGPRDWGPGDKAWERIASGHQWCVWGLDKPSRDAMDTILTSSFVEKDPITSLFAPPPFLHDD
mmetsp:Transcript_9648/g.27597  ORF Transcript_9648/g.27597 Transcript_9648/m.27597 type:complete len:677 (-) Transcript_9648:123-2153(-)